jgi:type VI secretion system protein ImpM
MTLASLSAGMPAGFFGKLVSHGDFVSRRLPESFMQVWDTWLRHGLHASRETLGAAWLETYLTSPVWRFALNAGVADESAWAGVLMPSVDRVGRHFPLTLAANSKGQPAMLEWLENEKLWFDELENLALSSLQPDFLLDDFDMALQKIIGLPVGMRVNAAINRKEARDQSAWCIAINDITGISAHMAAITKDIAQALLSTHSLWWTDGSPHVSPSVLVCSGLPSASQFTAMLSGNWNQSGWQTPEIIL